MINFFIALLLFASIVLAMKKAPEFLNVLLASTCLRIHSVCISSSTAKQRSPGRLLPSELQPYDSAAAAAASRVCLLVLGGHPYTAVLSLDREPTSVTESRSLSAWHLHNLLSVCMQVGAIAACTPAFWVLPHATSWLGKMQFQRPAKQI